MIAILSKPEANELHPTKISSIKTASTMSSPELLPYGITIFAHGVDSVLE